MTEDFKPDEFGGRPFTSEERRALHRLAEREKELEKIVEVYRAKRVVWDFILKLAGFITAVVAAIWAVKEFFLGKGS